MRLYLRVTRTFAKAVSQGGLFSDPATNPNLHTEKRTDKRGRSVTRRVRTQEQASAFNLPQKPAPQKKMRLKVNVPAPAAPARQREQGGVFDGPVQAAQGERRPLSGGMFSDPKPADAETDARKAEGKDFADIRDRLHREHYDDLEQKAATLKGKRASVTVKGRQGEDIPLKGTLHAMPKGGELLVHHEDYGTGKGFHVTHVGTGARLTSHVMQSEHAAKLLVGAVKHHDFGFSKLDQADPALKQDVWDHQRSIRDGASRPDLVERAAEEAKRRTGRV